MFPNPQDALPIPLRPSLEGYKKIAKDLVKACKSDDPEQIQNWANDWVENLLARCAPALKFPPTRIQSWIDSVEDFAKERMTSGNTKPKKCSLTAAQLIVARSQGFESWPKFAKHIEGVALADTVVSKFEQAADAIVSGDIPVLMQLLDETPELIHARSIREHNATLLHYVAANGVENYRQRTPVNIVEIANILLRAGAELDATANVYGGGCTALGLAATSVHPEEARVQEGLLKTLIDHGATLELMVAGNRQSLVMACLANGRLKAAEFMAAHGATVGLTESAALGRLEAVKSFFHGNEKARPTQKQLDEAMRYACEYGQNEVVEYLLGLGADLSSHGGDGQTALHCSVFTDHLETVQLLLKHNPPLEFENAYGGTPLGQAMWSAGHSDEKHHAGFVAILKALIAAGAKVPPRHVPVIPEIDELLRRYRSDPEPSWYWYGEKPRGRRLRES